jgi:hypothetical protein
MQHKLEQITQELLAKLDDASKTGSWCKAEVLALIDLHHAQQRALLDHRVLQHLHAK